MQHKKRSSQHRNNRDSNKRLACATWVIAGAGILSFVAALLQWNVLSSQLAEMRADKRPWISTNVTIVSPLIYEKEHVSIKLKITMKNVGHSPAASLRPYAVMFFRNPRSLNAIEMQQEWCAQEGGKLLAVGYGQGDTLFPGEIRDEIYSVSLKWEEVERERPDLEKYKSLPNATIIVCVDYKFAISDDIRRTATLYKLTRADSFFPSPINLEKIPVSAENLRLVSYGSHAD
jgi:hypothetical protein